MSIGIMDSDMSTYTLVPFNLECMKLSAYYKRRNEIVVLAPQFTPEKHQKFFFRKDWDDGNYPSGLFNTPNLEYGGYAFTNNQYAPLPLEIEKMRPDTSLYAKMQAKICNAPNAVKYRKKIYQNMTEAEHCRISLDGKTVWPEYNSQFHMLKIARNIMFHDYDLGAIKNGFETVQDILSRARTDGWATKVGMKFPVQITKGEDLLKWSSLNTNSTFFSLRYTGIIDNNSFLKWVGVCRQRAVFKQMEYIVTAPWYDTNQFIKEGLPQILRQVTISRTYNVFFSLKYDKDFFPDPRWGRVIDLFNYYHRAYEGFPQSIYLSTLLDNTLFRFAAACASESAPYKPRIYGGEIMHPDEMRELFAFVRDNHPSLFNDFYNLTARSLGGKL